MSVQGLVRRHDTATATADADNTPAHLAVDASGNLYVTGEVSSDFAPSTSGGLSIFRSLDLDETEEDVKTSAGQLYGIWFCNNATSTVYLKLYNAAAASVTVGTTTPVITLPIPGATAGDDVTGVFSSTHGIAFGTAICAAATTGVADNDTGAPAANQLVVNIFYK